MPLKIQSYNGDKLLMTLEYKNYSINSGIKDAEFKFKPLEGTEVIII
jgi:outer membrane lipoprotein-sorting protein